MKAAVLFQKGEMPQYVDFPEPIAKNDDEVVVAVKAVAIKHLDKSRASGKHYSTLKLTQKESVVGGDGVCMLEDGSRVYAMAVNGMAAEKAVVYKDRMVKIPALLDNMTAAALPNAVIGSAMALRFKAAIQPGDIVLINGATSFTGRVAVQIAKYYGAKKVIVTGRNPQSLAELAELGADEQVSLLQDDTQIVEQLARIHMQTPIDVVIDYLWGHTAELLLSVIKGDGSFTNQIRYVSVGSIAGDLIQLSAASLRGTDLQLTGSGLGSWSKKQVGLLFSDILPEMFELAAAGKLKIETISVKLENVAELWDLEVSGGKRLVLSVG